jgi:hypothetical protein
MAKVRGKARGEKKNYFLTRDNFIQLTDDIEYIQRLLYNLDQKIRSVYYKGVFIK